MNRFEYMQASMYSDETVVLQETSIKLYDGHEKVTKLNCAS